MTSIPALAADPSPLTRRMVPAAWDAVRLLARDRVVLFGGVHAANRRARRFYLRHGFAEVGTFTDDAGVECIDMMCDLP